MARKDILFPVGRLVEGSLTKPQTTDMEGRPLTVKSGANTGQARVDYYFAVAIPKGNEQPWAQTPWGAIIYQAGVDAFPNHVASPTFAWKVKDGDSRIPNAKNKIPQDKEGFKGHWIVNFSSGFAPKTFNSNGTAVVDPESIKLGHYVQVFANVDGNGSALKPGVFINHSMVSHSGFGPEIYVGPDPTAVGFGQAPAPAGMSATPVAGIATTANVPGAAAPPPPVAAAAPPPPVAGHMMTPKAAGQSYEAMCASGWTDALLIEHGMMLAPTAAPAMPAVPTVPNPAILAPPPLPAAHAMTPKAAGATYEALIAAGWTDALLIQHGMMTA
jgi:hypothetical protein